MYTKLRVFNYITYISLNWGVKNNNYFRFFRKKLGAEVNATLISMKNESISENES